MEICERSRCTGCQVCMNVCPRNAISFVEDERGFSYPEISDECINCGACQKVCPRESGTMLNPPNENNVYAAFSKDKAIRMCSSSGGLFSEIATSVLSKGGLVFATKFDSDCRGVSFACCDSIEKLSAFRGSKYIQSMPGMVYKDVKSSLQMGKTILFIGVPCQVDALKKFLGCDYPNLLTIDIICHGVPSPKLWRDYCQIIETRNRSCVVGANFRYKKPSWTRFSIKTKLENGKEVVSSKFDDPYLISFLKEISMRENCYQCEYTSTKRAGDITLADFWGYQSRTFKMRNTEEGISLVLINTKKGEDAFKEIEDKIFVQKRTLKEAIQGNRSLSEPWKKNSISDEFWDEYLKGKGVEVAFQKYCRPYRVPLKMYANWFIANHMFMVPKCILLMRKKLKKEK